MLGRIFLMLAFFSASVSAHAGFWDELQKAAEVVDAVTQEPAAAGDKEVSDYRNPADPAFEEWVRMWENRVLSNVELIRYRDALVERHHQQFETQLRDHAGDFEKRPGWKHDLFLDNKQQRIRQLADCIAFEVSGDNRIQTSSYPALASQPFRKGELAFEKAENCLNAFSQVVVSENKYFSSKLSEIESQLAAANKEQKSGYKAAPEKHETGFMGIVLGMSSRDAKFRIEQEICPGAKKLVAHFLDRTEYHWYPDCLDLQGMSADLLVNKGKRVNEIRVFYHRYDPAVFRKLQKVLAEKYTQDVSFNKRQRSELARSRDMQFEIYDDGRVLLTVEGTGIQSSMSVWYMSRQASSYPEFANKIEKLLKEKSRSESEKSSIGYDAF